jgi:hypothetical protein
MRNTAIVQDTFGAWEVERTPTAVVHKLWKCHHATTAVESLHSAGVVFAKAMEAKALLQVPFCCTYEASHANTLQSCRPET